MADETFITNSRAEPRHAARKKSHTGPLPLPESAQTRQRPKLIIIDDDPYLVPCLKRILGSVCNVPAAFSTTHSLEKAMRLFEEHSPDIVLCDKNFCSDPNGHLKLLSLVKMVKPETTVILFTGDSLQEEPVSSGGQLFDGMIAKGIGRDELIHRVMGAAKKEE